MKNIFFKSAMIHGAIIGVLLIVYSLALYLLEVDLYSPDSSYKFLSYFSYIIIAVGIAISIRFYRERNNFMSLFF